VIRRYTCPIRCRANRTRVSSHYHHRQSKESRRFLRSYCTSLIRYRPSNTTWYFTRTRRRVPRHRFCTIIIANTTGCKLLSSGSRDLLRGKAACVTFVLHGRRYAHRAHGDGSQTATFLLVFWAIRSLDSVALAGVVHGRIWRKTHR
jgi:hypothetical protein